MTKKPVQNKHPKQPKTPEHQDATYIQKKSIFKAET